MTAATGKRRRDIILQQAAALFARNGVASTTVREIADEVGILSGSLYHHFDSKDSMVQEIVMSYLDDLRDRSRESAAEAGSARERLGALIKVSLEVAEAHPNATQIYQNETVFLRTLPQSTLIGQAAGEIHEIWAEAISSGVSGGEFRDDLDARLFHRLLRDAVFLSVRWYRPTPERPIGRLAGELLSTFLDGFATVRATRS
ncbi:TetR/AcrR family transcriptional regulator [Streptomyces sp. GC420]|uniref:TetR/AcrR family transcriptional regulator n=1 Tax=Streptomyces sp. GC420 TaxID=2697568 RepID=UPI001414DF0F|nr:TetR/AcrR family transcriptional regulator [Streptomyces sp. GC420]NBM20262.1 TetR family transcriptional regulator [Streptomyces sp. GC420]